MQCPLTYDQNALDLFIETMNTNLVPLQVPTSDHPAHGLPKTDDRKGPAQSKIESDYLISDGEDFGDDTDEIANDIDAKTLNYLPWALEPSREADLCRRSYKTDNQGNPVISKLNATSLKKLATDQLASILKQ